MTTAPLGMIYIELLFKKFTPLNCTFLRKRELLDVPCLKYIIGGNAARPTVYIICQFIIYSKRPKAFGQKDRNN